MSGKAAKVVITERQQETLRRIVAQRTAPQQLAQRARIVLLAFDGFENRTIGEEVGWGPDRLRQRPDGNDVARETREACAASDS